MSKETPLEVQKILKYRYMVASEGSLIRGTYRNIVPEILREFGVLMTTRLHMYAEKLDHSYWHALHPTFSRMTLDTLERLIKTCIAVFASAAFVLLLDKFRHAWQKRKSESKGRARQVKVHRKRNFSAETGRKNPEQRQGLRSA